MIGTPQYLTVLGRVGLAFASRQSRLGVAPGRVRLGHWRDVARLHAFPDLKRLHRTALTRLLRILCRAEAACIAAEREAYRLMYGRSEAIEFYSQLSQATEKRND